MCKFYDNNFPVKWDCHTPPKKHEGITALSDAETADLDLTVNIFKKWKESTQRIQHILSISAKKLQKRYTSTCMKASIHEGSSANFKTVLYTAILENETVPETYGANKKAKLQK